MSETKSKMKITARIASDYGVSYLSAQAALKYINYYLHDKNTKETMTNDRFVKYIKQFQKQVGIKANGILTESVVKLMAHLPRCGVNDIKTRGVSKWGLKTVTYFIEKYVNGISKADQDNIIDMAWRSWMQYADIKLVRTTNRGNANIIISTGRGAKDQFDGPSNTLAWAYLPSNNNYKGQLLMRFDLDETWITNASDRGILLLNVAAHEFGHLLGLDHSQLSKALMAPFYSASISKPQQNDDVKRIQALYGIATDFGGGGTTPTQPTDDLLNIQLKCKSSDLLINGKKIVDFALV